MSMRASMIAATVTFATVTLLTAAPLLAQGGGADDPSVYLTGFGGFATGMGTVTSGGTTASVSNTSSDIGAEIGVRIAPHVMVFGDIGRFGYLQADLQSTVNVTTANLANQGLIVTGGGSLPAWYGLGGLRLEIPIHSRVQPYVLSGIGVAHLNPNATFTYVSGLTPGVFPTPIAGMDATAALTSAGIITAPPASAALMFTLGAGVQIPAGAHWVIDTGYRYSRIAADSTLNASSLIANGITFGFGCRF
jgi:opacity protein-like surface antigen